jgi:hypothetical protein
MRNDDRYVNSYFLLVRSLKLVWVRPLIFLRQGMVAVAILTYKKDENQEQSSNRQ